MMLSVDDMIMIMREEYANSHCNDYVPLLVDHERIEDELLAMMIPNNEM
jgi:hypothetical protein